MRETSTQVQERYDDYSTPDREAALAELATIDCPTAFCVVDFGPLGFGIMREDSARLILIASMIVATTRRTS